MKTIILLAPLWLFLLFALLNLDIFSHEQKVNIFYIWEFDMPIFIYSILFFSLYVLFIWIIVQFSDFFTVRWKKKSWNQINALKAELYDNQKDLITRLTQEFQDENIKNMRIFKSENEKIITQMQFELSIIKEKLTQRELEK